MTDAKYDNNSVPGLLGTSNADGKTPLRVWVSPISHGLVVDDNNTGSDHPKTDAARDQNSETCMMGTSSTDGKTPVAVYIDSVTNKLLVKST